MYKHLIDIDFTGFVYIEQFVIDVKHKYLVHCYKMLQLQCWQHEIGQFE